MPCPQYGFIGAKRFPQMFIYSAQRQDIGTFEGSFDPITASAPSATVLYAAALFLFSMPTWDPERKKVAPEFELRRRETLFAPTANCRRLRSPTATVAICRTP